MLARIRMVGGALVGEVERDGQAMLMGDSNQVMKFVEGAQLRMNGFVPALFRSDRPGTAGLAGRRPDTVVGAFTVAAPDRVYRRQVQDVEPHPGDVRQAALDIGGRSLV